MSAVPRFPLCTDGAQGRARPDIARFNVGGKVFMVALSTLRFHPDCVLTKMVKYDSEMEVKGCVDLHLTEARYRQREGTPISDMHSPGSNPELFIDRDPDMFAIILNYLRTSRLVLPSDKTVCLHALQHEAEYYNIPGLAASISRYRSPPFVLYSVSRTGERWGSAMTFCLRLALPDKESLRAIVGAKPFEDLKGFASNSLQLVEEVCERENKKEEEFGSGFTWSIAGVQFGQDPTSLFLVYLQRSDSRTGGDLVYCNPPASFSVPAKPKLAHSMWPGAETIAAIGIVLAIWLWTTLSA